MKTLCRMWGNEGILEVLMSTPGLVVVLIGLWVKLVQVTRRPGTGLGLLGGHCLHTVLVKSGDDTAEQPWRFQHCGTLYHQVVCFDSQRKIFIASFSRVLFR